ncbi:MAG: PH domain-containing protein [Nocardioides sp.]
MPDLHSSIWSPPPHGPEVKSIRLSDHSLGYLGVRSAIATAIFVSGILAIATLIGAWDENRIWALLAVAISVCGGLLDVTLLNRLEIRHTICTATPSLLRIDRGRVFRRSTIVRLDHILNTEVVQGPLLRAFGLYKFRFTGALSQVIFGPVDSDSIEFIQEHVISAKAGQ